MNSVLATEPTVLFQFQLLGILLLSLFIPSVCIISPFTFATGKTNSHYLSFSHFLPTSVRGDLVKRALEFFAQSKK